MRRLGDVEYRNQVIQRIERRRLFQERLDHQVAAGTDHQRIAVRRRTHHEFRRDIPRCAGLVVHHDRLRELLRQAFRAQARKEIGESAGRSIDHQPDAAARINGGVLPRAQRCGQRENQPCSQTEPIYPSRPSVRFAA